MPHNLFNDRMAFVGEAAWHDLGTEVPPDVPAAQMIAAAGLDWPVWKQPAPGAAYDRRTKRYDHYLVMRQAHGAETENALLGMVGREYEPLQNVEAFRFFEPFVERGWAGFETAGALGRGERVWVLARLRDEMLVGGQDKMHRYLLLSNSHDGSSAVSVRFTCVRVVCQNTLILSSRSGKSKSAVSIPHTRNLHDKLRFEQANKLKELSANVFGAAAGLFNRMAERGMVQDEVENYLQGLFPRTNNQEKLDVVPIRWSRVFSILQDDSITPHATRDTLWPLYNAVVRDEDFRATREAAPSARLNRIWFGRGSQLKLQALEAARALVEPLSLN